MTATDSGLRVGANRQEVRVRPRRLDRLVHRRTEALRWSEHSDSLHIKGRLTIACVPSLLEPALLLSKLEFAEVYQTTPRPSKFMTTLRAFASSSESASCS